jgi:hypothetical protein
LKPTVGIQAFLQVDAGSYSSGLSSAVIGGMITIATGAKISKKRIIVIFFNLQALIFDSHLGKTLMF